MGCLLADQLMSNFLSNLCSARLLIDQAERVTNSPVTGFERSTTSSHTVRGTPKPDQQVALPLTSSELTQSPIPRRKGMVRRMSESQLASLLVIRPADVTIAARKARILAALADVEKSRRSRFGKATAEVCRSILSFGGIASVEFGTVSPEGQPAIQATIRWQVADDSPIESTDADLSARTGIPLTPVAGSESTGAVEAPAETSVPEMAIRRIGELLDGFTLAGWPGPGAVATLRLSAP